MAAPKPDYTLFDNAILSHVKAGKKHFYELNSGRLLKFANKLAGTDRHGLPKGFRLIDRRLQALRRAGRLTHDHKTGWAVAAGVGEVPHGVAVTFEPQPSDPEDNLETAIRRFGGRMVLNRTPRGRKLLKQMEAIYAEKDADGVPAPGTTPTEGGKPHG